MAYIPNDEANHHAYVVEGVIAYEESTILVVCATGHQAVTWCDQYKLDNPDMEYDRLFLAKVEFIPE